MKLFFTAFSVHNPYSAGFMQEHSVFPIGTEISSGIDLDYSAILIAEKFIIDASALEFVKQRKHLHLKPMAYSLSVLESEGLLEVQNFGDMCKPHHSAIVKKTEALVEDVDGWLPVAKAQWRVLKPELEEFQRLYGLKDRVKLDVSHFGVVNFLMKRDGEIKDSEFARLHSLIESPKRRLKSSDKADLREILKPLVAQVIMNDLIRKKLESPFIDWDDAQGFYSRFYLGQWTEIGKANFPSLGIAENARCLFDMIIPELKPSNIGEVVKFIKKRGAVPSLRKELWDLLANGEAVSKDWMLKVLNEATKAQLITEKRNRIIKWIGRIAGLVIPGGDLLGGIGVGAIDAVKDVILDASETSAEAISNRSGKARFEWYYALQHIQLNHSPKA